MSGFEGAREAMEAGIVGSAEPVQPNIVDSVGETFADSNIIEGSKDALAKNTSNILELDSLASFKYKGRDLSPKDLDNWERGNMMQSDYTKKTQAISEERKYYDNLHVDLASVRDNPALANEFRKTYPEKFHNYLDFLGNRNTQNPETQPEGIKPSLDPEIMSRLQKVDQMENYIREQEVKAVDAKLDVIFQKMAVKYPMADEERVLAMAQGLHNQGTKLDDAMWDKIWSAVQQKTEGMFKTYQKNLVSKQQEASGKAKDTAPGGGTVGQAPKRMSFREATEQAVSDLKSGNLR